jgi:peroxiredoxin
MKKALLFFVFFLSLLSGVAQKVTIKGSALGYEYREIGVWQALDYISHLPKQLTYTSIDSSGKFNLEFNSKSIQYITLRIDKHIASMYVQPGMNYEIKVLPPDSTTYQNPNIDHDVKISISMKSRTEINALTMDYDKRFDDFLGADYLAFVARTPQKKIDSFKVAMKEYYSTVTNEYFNTYIDYTIAALEGKTKSSEKKLAETYLFRKPIKYNHPEYMNFFNDFFKQRLQNFAAGKTGGGMYRQVDDLASLNGAMSLLKKDPMLANDTIRELVLIKGLYESFYDGSFRRSSIIAMLEAATRESKIPEHRQIAQNMLNSFSKLQKGTLAPGFNLPDKSGETHSLDELRTNKFAYLMFYDEKCSTCMQQMKVVASLQKTYGDRVAFVSISTDKTNAELKNFQMKNPGFNWLFLYDNTLGQLKKEYEIKSLPAYFLIGLDGKFIQVPADSPDEEIEQVFYDLTKLKSKLHNVGSKEN